MKNDSLVDEFFEVADVYGHLHNHINFKMGKYPDLENNFLHIKRCATKENVNELKSIIAKSFTLEEINEALKLLKNPLLPKINMVIGEIVNEFIENQKIEIRG